MKTEKEMSIYHCRCDKCYEEGKAEAIKFGNELIEEYFDKPSSVFWDKVVEELAK